MICALIVSCIVPHLKSSPEWNTPVGVGLNGFINVNYITKMPNSKLKIHI